MFFVNRQILRPPINLAGAGENNFHAPIVQPASFKNVQLRRGVDVQIGERIRHRIEVASLAREVEEKVASLDQGGHGVWVAYIRRVQFDAIPDVVDIEEVAPIFRNQAVNQHDLCAQVDETPGQRGTDESQTACDEDIRPGENTGVEGHSKL